jgi:hypothetical protein
VAPTGTVLKAYLRISGALRSTVLKVMQELQNISRYCTWVKHSFAFVFARSQHFHSIMFKLSKPSTLRWLRLYFFHPVFLILSHSFIGAFICSSNYPFIQSTTSSSSLACIFLSIHKFSNPSKYPLIHTLIQPCPSVRSILRKLTRTSFHFSAFKKCDKILYQSTRVWLKFTSTHLCYFFVQRYN